MVAGAAGRLLLGLRVWCGCLPVAQWVVLGAVRCGASLCTSASPPDDLVTLYCSASSCGAALHCTPPHPGERLTCHWHSSLPVYLVGKGCEIWPAPS